jgi:hypothetical protein
LLAAPSVSALTISPPSLEFNLDPGQTVTQRIKLYNDESKPLTVYSSTANFTAQGETGEPTFDLSAAPSDLSAWITVADGPFTINSKDKIEVTATIAIPANAEPGGHYASIFFGPQPTAAAGDKQVNIKSLIGSLAIVRVSGDVRERAAIAVFALNRTSTTLNRLPAEFFLRLNNSGNVHVRPAGTVTIKNLFGQTSAVLTVNENKGAVLPETTRKFEVAWAKAATPAATGNFFTEIGREWQNFGFGPYTAATDLTYGQGQQTLTSSLKFFILPWRLLLVVLIGLAIIIYLLIIGIRGYNRSIITHARIKTGPPGAGEKK